MKTRQEQWKIYEGGDVANVSAAQPALAADASPLCFGGAADTPHRAAVEGHISLTMHSPRRESAPRAHVRGWDGHPRQPPGRLP
jgi:hypothetical protein